MKRGFVRLLILVQVAAALAGPVAGELSMGYYGMTCPFAEYIVRNVVGEALMKDPTLAGSLLRLHFHDCFVRVHTLRTRRRPSNPPCRVGVDRRPSPRFPTSDAECVRLVRDATARCSSTARRAARPRRRPRPT